MYCTSSTINSDVRQTKPTETPDEQRGEHRAKPSGKQPARGTSTKPQSSESNGLYHAEHTGDSTSPDAASGRDAPMPCVDYMAPKPNRHGGNPTTREE